MKAGIYDPYLDTLGGGERYMMTAADCLAKNGWRVDIFWDDRGVRKGIEERLGIDLAKINFVPDIFQKSLIQKYQILKNYDLIFYLSDGSVPFLFGKKNILHFQVPFHDLDGRGLINKLKLKKIDTVVCNSEFTKKFIDKEYGVESKVIYPPVMVDEFRPGKKENMILSVARFTDLLHNKRQDVLVEGFKRMMKAPACRQGKDLSGYLSGWKLILVGGDKEGKQLVKNLKKEAKGYPIEVMTNLHFNQLKRLYGKAKIFWSASGFGFDEEKEPERVEHFGITTVEAMAAGCVPIVTAKGGQKEIINDGENGFLWRTEKELFGKTLILIKDQDLLLGLSKKSRKRSKDFSQKKFCQEIKKLLMEE